MSFEKKIKRLVSLLFPKGLAKERLKLIWYNLRSNHFVKYGIVLNENSEMLFRTDYHNFTFHTNEPLYSITPDFDNYQHYYKIKLGDIVIDGGANVGILSLLFSMQVGSDGFVHCFEPDIYNIEKLKSNFSLNTQLDNYKVNTELMWSEETLIDFQESGTVASSALWFSDIDDVVKKKTTTLDLWCAKHSIERLNFIKMDIEGAELQAIEGCVDIILKYRPNFAIASYHEVDGEQTYIKLERFFESINYPYLTKRFGGYEIITFAGDSLSEVINNKS